MPNDVMDTTEIIHNAQDVVARATQRIADLEAELAFEKLRVQAWHGNSDEWQAESERLRALIHHEHRPNPNMYGNLPRVKEILSQEGSPDDCTNWLCRKAAPQKKEEQQ